MCGNSQHFQVEQTTQCVGWGSRIAQHLDIPKLHIKNRKTSLQSCPQEDARFSLRRIAERFWVNGIPRRDKLSIILSGSRFQSCNQEGDALASQESLVKNHLCIT